MRSLIMFFFLFAGIVTFVQCRKPDPEPVIPAISFASDKTAFETSDNAVFDFQVKLSESTDNTVTVVYETEDISAEEGADYEAVSGTLTFAPGETSKTISVNIVIDEFLEADEQFKVVLSNPVNGYLLDNVQEAVGTIKNEDDNLAISDEGYTSADSYPGMTLIWSDEFDGDEIDPAHWTYDLGDNGWGNQELQNYTSSDDNSYTQDGKLVIVARDEGGSYTSARLKSIGLQEFQYGRIDVRALLPVDVGMWPAIWMLGANYPEVGWPACGEIDIMELVGSNPRRIHGTVHWGANNSMHQYDGQGVSLPFPDTFADEFHVFSIEWEENSIRWLLDDEEYFSIDGNVTGTQDYPFNDEFFFIMNVAVGGQWPGDPDSSTTFPEFMAVDYVRVFQ
ncbi:MAG: family 16 glycosylhydrolase [Flavobacteriales bacterium]|nr:family 16 glycosylhydrolase [Flavobacteriales bacterium]